MQNNVAIFASKYMIRTYHNFLQHLFIIIIIYRFVLY